MKSDGASRVSSSGTETWQMMADTLIVLKKLAKLSAITELEREGGGGRAVFLSWSGLCGIGDDLAVAVCSYSLSA